MQIKFLNKRNLSKNFNILKQLELDKAGIKILFQYLLLKSNIILKKTKKSFLNILAQKNIKHTEMNKSELISCKFLTNELLIKKAI